MATEDKSDVECEAIKANIGLGLSVQCCLHTVYASRAEWEVKCSDMKFDCFTQLGHKGV